MKFEGIIPPAITPFAADGSVDAEGYRVILEEMIAKGVHAVIAGGTTGEVYALNAEERVDQFRRAREITNGKVPLVCGVNDLTTEGACRFAAAAREAGADALLVAAPPYSLPTQDELAEHCLAIDRAAGLPIILYNYPGRTGVEMGRDFLVKVRAGSKNFQCIKESSGDINRLHMLVGGFDGLQISCGAEDQALEFFAWGATSWVTPMGNFFAEEVVALFETCTLDKDFDKARRIMAALLGLTTVLESAGQLVQCTKLACETVGLPGGPVRRPMGPLDEDFAASVKATVLEAKEAIARILSEDALPKARTA